MNNLFDIQDEMDDFEKNLNKYLDNNTISKASPFPLQGIVQLHFPSCIFFVEFQ